MEMTAIVSALFVFVIAILIGLVGNYLFSSRKGGGEFKVIEDSAADKQRDFNLQILEDSQLDQVRDLFKRQLQDGMVKKGGDYVSLQNVKGFGDFTGVAIMFLKGEYTLELSKLQKDAIMKGLDKIFHDQVDCVQVHQHETDAGVRFEVSFSGSVPKPKPVKYKLANASA